MKNIFYFLQFVLISCNPVDCYASLDEYEAHYKDVYEAIEDRAFIRGWLPLYLPKTSTDIREFHDIDTNETLIRFRFDTNDFKDIEEINKYCSVIEKNNVIFPRKQRVKVVKWWPIDLVQEENSSNNYKYYRCDKDKSRYWGNYLSIDIVNSVGFFWRL